MDILTLINRVLKIYCRIKDKKKLEQIHLEQLKIRKRLEAEACYFDGILDLKKTHPIRKGFDKLFLRWVSINMVMRLRLSQSIARCWWLS